MRAPLRARHVTRLVNDPVPVIGMPVLVFGIGAAVA